MPIIKTAKTQNVGIIENHQLFQEVTTINSSLYVFCLLFIKKKKPKT